MKNKLFVSVLTLNWNGKEDTIECVDSLLKLEYLNYEVVIIDNGSKDGSVDAFKERYEDKVHIIENSTNLGFGGGFNVGIDYSINSEADYTLIINNDTVADKYFLKHLVNVAEDYEAVGIVTGKVYFYDDRNRLQTVGRKINRKTIYGSHIGSGVLDEGQFDEIKEYEFVDDVYWLVKNSLLEKIKGYDANNFFFMGEELDFALRARNAGYRIFFTPHSKVWHKVSRSTGGLGNHKSLISTKFAQIVFYKKHMNYTNLLFYSIYKVFFHSPYLFLKYFLIGKYKHAFGQLNGLWFGLIWEIKN